MEYTKDRNGVLKILAVRDIEIEQLQAKIERLEEEKENHKNAHIAVNKLCNETLAENERFLKEREVAFVALNNAQLTITGGVDLGNQVKKALEYTNRLRAKIERLEKKIRQLT